MSVVSYIKEIQAKRVNFKALPQKHRIAIVGFLKSDGLLVEEIANMCGLSVPMVYHYWKKYQATLADMVKRSAGQFIGRLIAKGEHLYKSAKKEGKLELCWKIETDLLDRLIKLGWIESKPQQIELVVGKDAESPEILEAQLADDLSLLERLKQRAEGSKEKTIIDIEPSGNGNGASGNGRTE